MEEAKLKQLHFIVIPFPSQGHLTPLMNLCNSLAQTGAFVTVANIEPVHRQLQSKFSSCSLNLVGLPFELDAPTGVNSFWYHRMLEFGQALLRFRGLIQDLVREIVDKAEFKRYILITDYFMWCRDIALEFGAVFVNYWPGTATWYLIHHHLDVLASRGDIVVRDPEKVITYVPGVEPLKLADFPRYVHPGDPVGFEFFLEAPAACKDDWFLVNSVYELEPKAFDTVRELLGFRCVSVAPSFPIEEREEAPAVSYSLKNEDFSCIKWLDKQQARSVLYVSFGSIAPVSESEVLILAEALEVSKVKYLWVVKQEHFPREHAEFFSDFVLRVRNSEQRMVIEWAPQVEVLGHTAVGGFVSHCGWNSVMESICYGVPIIGWPCISEQRLNCKLAVEDWKMGLRVNKADRQELQLIFTEFMSNREEFAKNAAALKRLVRGAVVSENLSSFVRDIAE